MELVGATEDDVDTLVVLHVVDLFVDEAYRNRGHGCGAVLRGLRVRGETGPVHAPPEGGFAVVTHRVA
ncbi:hypothetical protein C2R22_08815 [Salinigranum rubrum]|uniref:Uncharacterized protein n=1 Tax=Salinigranum rubrum TaxID=755307 RepID=A0A2I8VIH5_9EURY|nr:hypothetical protein [Salinigranum rubrum]AUV81737.1 hypothetical protein C2R22_08815 [Salinigranum rubrum]